MAQNGYHVDYAGPLRLWQSARAFCSLPINAGVGGMIPLIIMAILAPDDLFARGLAASCCPVKPGEDITEVVEELTSAVSAQVN